MTPITFAVYHTNLTEEAIETVVKYTDSLKKEEWQRFLPKYQTYLEALFKSTRLFHPNCNNVVITDQETPFELPQEIEIRRTDSDPGRPAYMRLKAQIDFLRKADGSSHIAFLDYDMLIQADLTPLFNQTFDIALTYRNHQKRATPINGGLMIIPSTRIKEALQFLERVLTIYEKTYTDKWQVWGGVQQSLRDAINADNFFSRTSDLMEIENIKILLLPADTYNFSTTDDRLMIDYYPDKKILHFKGNRKNDMVAYWKQYLKRRGREEKRKEERTP